MARSQNSFIKKQKAEKKRKKQAEKLAKRLDKKNQETSGSLDDMIAYVDEFGNIVDTPEEAAPEEHKSSKEDEGKE
ncbi:MAG: cold-shock protein [Cyclobacteriaceae bacterium]